MDTSKSSTPISDSNQPLEIPTTPTLPAPSRRVAYVSSPSFTSLASQLPSNIGRSRLVQDLVRALGLLKGEDEEEMGGDNGHKQEEGRDPSPPRATVIAPLKVGRKELGRFHDLDYVGESRLSLPLILHPNLILFHPLADVLLSAKTVISPTNSPTSSPSSSSQSSSDDENDSDSSSSPKRKRPKPNPTPTSNVARKLLSLQKFGLLDDSPPFPSLAFYVLGLAGSALGAAQAVKDGSADVSICWDGGRHHGRREAASGFCYINDVVLVILSLLQQRISIPNSPLPDLQEEDDRPQKTRKPRILYLDFDVHHGDGVANAFLSPLSPPLPSTSSTSTSSKLPPGAPQVLTLSIHHHALGFFPSSPLSSLTPADTPHPHTLSLPLQVGASAASLTRVWEECVEKVRQSWKPDWVVVCCGVDGLAGDGKGVWNLGASEKVGELGWCVRRVVEWEDGIRGKVLLGGGE